MKYVKYGIYSKPSIPKSKEYIETAVSSFGFAHIYKLNEEVEIIGKAMSSDSIFFIEEIRKKYPKIGNAQIEPISKNEPEKIEQLLNWIERIRKNSE
mgnify:CR=1 FL=1